MSKKKYSLKEEDKNLLQKRLRELAADDYVDRASRAEISESDILGVSPSQSEEESRDDSVIKSMHRAEEEEADQLANSLQTYSLRDLCDAAREAGISVKSELGKEEIIRKLVRRLSSETVIRERFTGESGAPPQ